MSCTNKIFRRCLPPFSNYKSSGPLWHKKEGRMSINLLSFSEEPKTKVCTKSMTYARYLYCVSIGTEPHKGYEVDHIDGDRTNDVLTNLQLLVQKDNLTKQRKDPLFNSAIMFNMQCPSCKTWFLRRYPKTHMYLGHKASYCSKPCADEFSHKELAHPQEYYEVPKEKFIPQNKSVEWETVSEVFVEDLVKFSRVGNFIPKQVPNLSKTIIQGDPRRPKPNNNPGKDILSTEYPSLSMEAIGKKYGVSGAAVKKWLKKYGLLKGKAYRTKELLTNISTNGPV